MSLNNRDSNLQIDDDNTDCKYLQKDSDKSCKNKIQDSVSTLNVSILKPSRSESFASGHSSDDDITSKTENAVNNQYDDLNSSDSTFLYEKQWLQVIQHKNDYRYASSEQASSLCSELTKDFNERMIKQIKELKQTPQYTKMIKQGEKLLTDEIIALIYYTNSESGYHKIKNVDSKTSNDDKWKRLYFHATKAIEKIHQVFHYKNDKQKQVNRLFCGSFQNELVTNSDQLFFKTLTRFTSDFNAAQTYNNGNILVLDNIYKALHSGQLKGCDISWVCNNSECDFILLPMIAQNVHKLNQIDITEYGCSIESHINLYFSNKFLSVDEHNNIVGCKFIPLTSSRKSIECAMNDEKQNNYQFYNSNVVQEILRFEAEYESDAGGDNPYPEFDPRLVKEITEYENECTKCARTHTNGGSRRGNNNQNGRNRNKEHRVQRSNGKKDKHSKHNEEKDEKDEEKDNNNGDKNKKPKPFDLCEIIKKLKMLKQHKKYKIMQKQKEPLSDDELISLIYYCDSEHFCKQMKQAHRNKSRTDHQKFKTLYYHATKGVEKIYNVFHYKNRKQKYIKQLYHGSVLEKLDPLSQDQVFFKTIMSFSSNFGVAKSFATSSMLILDDAFKALINGHLKGADVRWISKFKEEYEYIVLPTTYHNFRKMKRVEIKSNIWLIGSDVNVYISNKYKSNKDPLCLHTDVILSEMTNSYDNYFAKLNKTRKSVTNLDVEKKLDNECEDICKIKFKKWLFCKVKLKQYLQLFEKGEYDSIAMIEFFDNDALEEIGIAKKIHRKFILKKAKEFTQSQKAFESLLEKNKCLKKYKDIFDSKGIITMQELENDIASINELGVILNVKAKKQLTNLWKAIHSSTEFDDID